MKLSVYKHLANLITNCSPVFIEYCGPLIIFNAKSIATIQSENCRSCFKDSKSLTAFKHSIDVVKSLKTIFLNYVLLFCIRLSIGNIYFKY